MNFYYCKSEWEHAVISARSQKRARRVFVDMINAQLEDNKKLGIRDVSAEDVNVYLDEDFSEYTDKDQKLWGGKK